MIDIHEIQALSTQLFPEIVKIRRHIHQHPELSFVEHKTRDFIQETLLSWGISSFRTVAQTGTIVILHGTDPRSFVLGLRADIDALPITETNELPYRSVHPGCMHACGHDIHTSCLLGAIHILHNTRHKWSGTIKAIFQPGEEKNPGGASLIIEQNGLKDPDVQAMLGLHVDTDLAVGEFSFRKGMVMASADELYITIKGNGGHAASPHRSVDTILVGAEIVCGLQHIIGRQKDPFDPSVLSICSFQGGHTTNVIPETVHLRGTFRAMNEQWRKRAHELIRTVAVQTASAYGAEAIVDIDLGYPTLHNHEALTDIIEKQAQELAGQHNCFTTNKRLGAEDFSYYSQVVPSCFYRLGVRNPAFTNIPTVHTPNFCPDEKALLHGTQMMAWLGTRMQDIRAGLVA